MRGKSPTENERSLESMRLRKLWLGHSDARQVSDLPSSASLNYSRSPTAKKGSETRKEIGKRLTVSRRLTAHRSVSARTREPPSGSRISFTQDVCRAIETHGPIN